MEHCVEKPHTGSWVVWEGIDNGGKSSLIKRVAEILPRNIFPKIQTAQSPGSTPLGVHLRQLLKFPETFNKDIAFDDMSRQLLYMVDTINFIKTKLEPWLADGTTVLCDRTALISMYAYGLASGLTIEEIDKIAQLPNPPKIDRLYVVCCPISVARSRLNAREEQDYFDKKPQEFYEKVAWFYENLTTHSPSLIMSINNIVHTENIKFLDSSVASIDQLANEVKNDLIKLAKDRL